MIRFSEDLADALDRLLGDGAASEVGAHLGALGEGEAAALVLRDARALLSVRCYGGGIVRSTWWTLSRGEAGELVVNGPMEDLDLLLLSAPTA